ncbi:MAG: hypothetical protein A2Y80_02100 [Deltaproteobacteria bacterium RBG_13_58_19]|nr:MAG: hypothetical protein A2Y80_02100 [Deltaproteobacteria bacterium RBG_13_58_19]
MGGGAKKMKLQVIIDKLKDGRIELLEARAMLAARVPLTSYLLVRLDLMDQWLGQFIKDLQVGEGL